MPDDKRLGQEVDVPQRVQLLVDTTSYALFRWLAGLGWPPA